MFVADGALLCVVHVLQLGVPIEGEILVHLAAEIGTIHCDKKYNQPLVMFGFKIKYL